MYRFNKFIFSLALLVFSTSLNGEDVNKRILLSGFTVHEKDLDNGNKLNEYNLGLGYEQDYFTEYGDFYTTYHTMILNDSNKNFQAYAAVGKSIRFEKPLTPWFDLSVGLAGVVSVKKMRQDDGEYQYRPIALIAPVSSFYIDDFTLNFSYIPSYSFTSYKTIGFLYVYFGWQF
ncbi:MAG: hypothetical protein PHO65_01035 [Sulfurovum sp.]|nr:hypothetical protein [Sulfurovum sp.]